MIDLKKIKVNYTDKILYLVPSDQEDKGGMTEITKMFFQVGFFDNKNIKHFNTFYKWGNSVVFKIFETFFHQLKFIVVLSTFRPKIIFVMTSSYMGFFEKCLYCFFARIFGVKSILNQVGDFANFYEKNKYKAGIIRQCLKIPNVVVVGSSYWNNYFKTNFPEVKISSIVNPVVSDLYFKSDNNEGDKIKIVTVSSIIRAKGVVELVAVIKKVCEVTDRFEFIIMGRGEKLEWVRNELKMEINLGLVDLKGQVSDDEKVRQFSLADIFILLSYNEVIPISMLEAMSASLPVLATNVGGIPDIVIENENGYLFSRMTVDPVVDRILKIGMQKSKNDLRIMGAKSKSIVESKYDIFKVLESHIELAKNL
jgi:glycosyltransferase involved in cell wall biosynthesis